ncbi:MAG TPA: carbohydrate-binding protein [Verrucomicrobiae bacterium]|jgi:hypothetical protein
MKSTARTRVGFPLLQLFITAILTFCCQTSLATHFYVSTTGNDANSGFGPNDVNALKTIQAAADKLRAGDTLSIRGGVYREMVVFRHSGTAEKPISVEPYKNEKVVITGCEPVVGWTLYTNNIWQAPMDWTLGLGRNQIFYDDDVLIEARYPYKPDPGLEMPVSGLSKLWPTFGKFSIPDDTRKSQPGRIVSKLLDGQPDNYWKGALYYGIHYQGWAAQTGIIESSKSGEIYVDHRTKNWWFTGRNGNGTEDGRGMIIGHIHALDQPGEWVWQTNMLFLIPPKGNQPTGLVEAKKRQLAFDLSGQQYIHIHRLIVKAASARLEDSAWCTFDHCDFSYISHFTLLYDVGQVEKGRDTIKSGETGIFISGHDNAFLGCSIRFSAGAGFYIRGYHQTIHNCLIDQVDYTSHYLDAITDAVADFRDYEDLLTGGHVITYNTMCNAGRHFFNFFGNGTSRVSRDRAPMNYMATLFAHNHLYNGMLETRDAGFLTGYFCSGGTLDGLNSQVCFNVMHDSYDPFAMRLDKLGIVYFDQGTCNIDLYNNLLWAKPGSLQHDFWYNTCCVGIREKDNIFHTNFTRTSAGLRPDDFPKGKPFRFGCNLNNPPPLPKWPPLNSQLVQANSCVSHSTGMVISTNNVDDLTNGSWLSFDAVDFKRNWQSVVLHFASDAKEMNTDTSNLALPRHQQATDPLVLESTVNDGARADVKKYWTFVHGFTNGAWLRFNQVPLGDGYQRFRIIYGHTNDLPRHLEIHMDSLTGPLIGAVILPKTDKPRVDWTQIYGEAVGDVSNKAIGTHDIFLVFHADDQKPIGEFEYFRFEQYKGQIALQTNEVKLEIHVGDKNGKLIGQIFPHYTGGLSDYRDFVARLEPVHEAGPMFIVVRSQLPRPIGKIGWIQMNKAVGPLKMRNY